MTPNLAAFAQVVRAAEGTAGPDGYRMLFGGGLFDSFEDHPRIIIEKSGYRSSAAGAFQILQGTWNDFQAWRVDQNLPMARFDEAGQNACFEWLIDRRGARQAIERGDLDTAIHLCCREWASLPGSPYGQPTRSLTYCKTVFARALDDVSLKPDVAISQPVEVPAAEPQPEESKFMLPALIPILLNALIPQIPVLAQAFGKTGEKTAAKVQAAASTLQVITQAVGAANEQEAVQRVQADPEARQKAQSALLSDPTFLSLIEVGGGIEAARKQAFDPAQIQFWKTGAFWISTLLLALPFMLAADVFYVHPTQYSGELRTQIVTAILVIISVVGAFWLGTTMSSQRKTEILAER